MTRRPRDAWPRRGREDGAATSGAIRRRLLLSLLGGAVLIALTSLFALPSLVRNRIATHTGCPVAAGAIRVNPFAGSLRVEQLQLRNPDGFATPEFLDLQLLDLDVDVLSLAGDELRVARAAIDLPKVTIVTRRDGVTNTSVVRDNIAAARGPSPRDASAAERKFRIGELVIRLGTVELVDYSRGAAPTRRTIALRADHRFTDVTDLRVVIRPLLADLARANATGLVGAFEGLLPDRLRDTFDGALDGVLDGAGGAVKKLIDSLPVGR